MSACASTNGRWRRARRVLIRGAAGFALAVGALLAGTSVRAGESAAPPAGSSSPAEATPSVRRGEMRRRLVLFEDAIRNEGKEPMRDVAVDALLPLELGRQHVRWIRFSPHAWTFRTDEHGQRIATAAVEEIPPGGATVFSWIASLDLAEETHELPPAAGSPPASAAPPPDAARYLGDAPSFGTASDAVRKASDEVRAAAGGDGALPAALVRAAAEHVRSKIAYRREGGWDPAPAVLARGTGSCSESTFAFVAICRRLGVPARWIGGTSLRAQPAGRAVDTTFHRIAEAWIPGHGWYPVETTSSRAASPEGGVGKVPAGLLCLGVGDGTGDAGAGASYFARERWGGRGAATRAKEQPRVAKQAKSRRFVWIGGVEDEVGLAGSLHGLADDAHPSFGRAELLACDLRGFGPASAADGKPLRGAAAPVRPEAADVARRLLAAGHPEGVRIAVLEPAIPRKDAETWLREVCDEALLDEVVPLFGRSAAEIESWWALHVDRVLPLDRGRLTLRAE